MPVLKHAAGHQPERILVVGRFGGWLVGQGEDVGSAIGVALLVIVSLATLIYLRIQTRPEDR